MSLRPFFATAVALTVVVSAAVAGHAQTPENNPPTASLPASVPASAPAPPTGLPIHHTFLTSTEGWVAEGKGAQAATVSNSARIDSARGALQMEYSVDADSAPALLLRVAPGALAKARAFQFDIRSDYAAKLNLGVEEKNGGHYFANFSVPKDKWQHVELNASDFDFEAGPAGSKDPNNKLDLDQVEDVVLTDAASVFVRANSPGINRMFGVVPGAHHIYLANFDISALPFPGASGAATPPDVLDAFSHPQIGWYMVGSAEAKTVNGTPLPGRGLSLKYMQSLDEISGALITFPRGKLTGATKISCAVASVKAAKILIMIENAEGDKYQTTLRIPAGATRARTASINFADFSSLDGKNGEKPSIDLTKIDRIAFIDSTDAAGANTLYLGDLRVIRP